MATPSPKPMVQDGFERREMTDAEFAQYEIDQANAAKSAIDAEAKAEVKASAIAKLAALGLTEGEVAAILA